MYSSPFIAWLLDKGASKGLKPEDYKVPHSSHKMDAYRDTLVWVAYCKVCSAETDDKLNVECSGQYQRKEVDKVKEQD